MISTIIISMYFIISVCSQMCSDDWDEFTVKDGSTVLFSVSKSNGVTSAKSLKVNNRDVLQAIDAKDQQIASLTNRIVALERYVAKLESHALGSLVAPATTTKKTNPSSGNPVTVNCGGKDLPMSCKNTCTFLVFF